MGKSGRTVWKRKGDERSEGVTAADCGAEKSEGIAPGCRLFSRSVSSSSSHPISQSHCPSNEAEHLFVCVFFAHRLLF